MSEQPVKSGKMGATKRLGIILCCFVAGILLLSWLAGLVHTDFGNVKIWDISYMTEEGGYQRALLYIPKSATAENPAPAIVACHGYNNTAEVQDINAIELSRRGYVVISIDAYRHGLSSETDPDMPEAMGGGTFAALQYLGTLPYVDTTNIGMIGHSMGGMNIQAGALQAFMLQAEDPNIIVPKAVVPTASFYMPGADGEPMLNPYPVDTAMINAQFEEFIQALDPTGKAKGDDLNTMPVITQVFGFERPEYGQYYAYGSNTPLDRAGAVAAADNTSLRAVYVLPVTHPGVHFSSRAAAYAVEFFDISLRDGQSTIAPTSQTWMWKHIFSGIALLGFIFMALPLGGLLLKTRFFATLVREEPRSYAVATGGKGWAKYLLLLAACALPAPLLYFLCMAVGTLMTSGLFPLTNVNGVALLNVVTAIISLVIFVILYKTIYKKDGATTDNMGVKLPVKQVLKALLLAVILFFAAYLMLVLVDYLFKVDFRFWVFSIRTLTPIKWGIWLRYLPFYLIFFLVTALTLNMTTRLRGKSEVLNTILVMLTSTIGLLVLCLLDYGSFFATGYKMFPTIMGASTGLFGILLWGVIFILPLAAAVSRYFFKKTGTIWLGAFTNTLIVTLYAVSNTIITTGTLY